MGTLVGPLPGCLWLDTGRLSTCKNWTGNLLPTYAHHTLFFFLRVVKKKSPSIFKKKKMADNIDNIEQPHPMEPAEWGRSAWKFLHACSFAFPENPSRKQRESALAVFNNLGDILPCPICRGHYKENIAVNPPRVSSKQELSHWLVELHNSVNKSRRAKEVDFDTVQRHYEGNSHELDCDCAYTRNLRAQLQRTQKTLNWLTVAAILLLVFIVVLMAMRRRR